MRPRLQGSANPRTPGLVNFVTAVAYHFCLSLPRAFSQPGARGLADHCKGGCVDLMLWSSPKFGHGGVGHKTGKFCGRHVHGP